MSNTPAIELRDLTLGYDRHPAVHHVTGEVAQGELLALVGPNGAGKSTLLKGLMGEIKPLDGAIDLDGLSHRDIAYLPQQIDIDRSFPDLGVRLHRHGAVARDRPLARPRCHRQAQGRRCAHHARHSRSRQPADRRALGGQFQRVLFARLLLQDCRLILLDEPFRAVDAKTVADLILLIRRWHEEGRTVIAALHDIEQVRAHFHETLLLAREVVAWGDTLTVLTPENLAKARHAVEAWEEHAGICERHDEVKEREPA